MDGVVGGAACVCTSISGGPAPPLSPAVSSPQPEQPATTPADPQSTAGSHPEDPECPFGPDYDSTWDAPWDELSVVELRSLLRCYPIDRRSLPAPIEWLRRDELIAALHQLQPLHP